MVPYPLEINQVPEELILITNSGGGAPEYRVTSWGFVAELVCGVLQKAQLGGLLGSDGLMIRGARTNRRVVSSLVNL